MNELEVGEGSGGTVRVTGKNIGVWVTKEEVAKKAGFDLSEWSIVRAKTWTTAMKNNEGEPVQAVNVSLHLRPRQEEVMSRLLRDNLLDEIRREVRGENPWKRDRNARSPKGKVLAELDLFDPHFQKLAWGEETGTNYDLNIAADTYAAAAYDLIIEVTQHDVERFLFPVGQDLFHTQLHSATARGTPQDVDTRPKKAATVVRKLLTHVVFEMLKHAPVDLVVTPGNHAPLSDWFMGEILDARFNEYDTVRVDNRPIFRKYYRYYDNLIGFAHGDNEPRKRLVNLMAQEAREDWAETRFREWHMGHWHHEVVKDDRGVLVRHLTSLCGTDAWHAQQGYAQSLRGAKAFVWTRHNGPRYIINHNIPVGEEEIKNNVSLTGGK